MSQFTNIGIGLGIGVSASIIIYALAAFAVWAVNKQQQSDDDNKGY